MTEAQRREAARRVSQKWHNKGKEDEDARSFWIEILQNILGMENVTDRVDFEKKVIGADGNTKRIDVYIPETRVLIEQKSLGIDLDKPQAGHNGQTPYEQAKYYDNCLPFDEKARWIVVSNFAEIRIYDMNARAPEPEIITIENLQTQSWRLQFLVQKENVNVTRELEISKDAGRLVGKIYDAFLKEYKEPENKDSLHSLNALCVRLVFCLYAEDAEIFGRHNMFRDFLKRFEPRDLRKALIELFDVLDQKPDARDAYIDPELAAFPYVNGGLFSDKNIEIPNFTQELKELLVNEACDFDWSEISPTIFGAVFESTLNPETRRSGGMHYTSVENIHKVIDPLFLDDLKKELEEIKEISVAKTRKDKLGAFQDKLASLRFLDPACGSGNFLTESYLSLRRLENEVLKLRIAADKGDVTGQIIFSLEGSSPIKVSIQQFYGIEINDFAVSVAMTALWIAESQMLKETEDVVHQRIDFLPLKSFTNIHEGNALRMDWGRLTPLRNATGNTVIYADKTNVINKDVVLVQEPFVTYGEIDLVTKELVIGKDNEENKEDYITYDYIMGNPPFYGARLMNSEQKSDLEFVFGKLKGVGNLDYVTGWYKKAVDYISDKNTKAAFVSTNSITQGEQVAILWKRLLSDDIEIKYAYRTFVWDNDADKKAHVHVVIICLAKKEYGSSEKIIYEVENENESTKINSYHANNINGYLIDGDNVFIDNRSTPICEDAPQARSGNKPIDDGNYLFEKEEMEEFIKAEPMSEKYFRPWIGSYEFINRKPRYCLWLGDATPSELRKMPKVMERIEKVRDFRLRSKSLGTVKLADRPTRFHVETILYEPFLVMPLTSSERRRYVPIGFITPDYLASNLVVVIANAKFYHFGVITSNVFMAWMRAVCGRLKSDYRITKDNVYNNFPWPAPTDEQRAEIEKKAQGILDARSIYPESSLADLYDPLTMPPELTKAHTENDRAVMRAYGFDIKTMSEADCVAELMRMYKEKTS